MLSIANRVRELRTERGLSQSELADAVGVSRQTVGAIEAGRHVPSVTIAIAIAQFFGVPVEKAFRGDVG
jgi:putative transcriptional regulator